MTYLGPAISQLKNLTTLYISNNNIGVSGALLLSSTLKQIKLLNVLDISIIYFNL